MKFLKIFLIAAASTAIFFSCSKVDGTIGQSTGTLKANDTTGDCLPITVAGTYTAGVDLTGDNYILVNVNVKSKGAFSIATDSVNGMYFSSIATQSFGITGLNEVHLYSHGRPTAPGLTTFTVSYGSSSCTFSINVGSLASGSYKLVSDSSGPLLPAVVSGVYTAGVKMGPSDSVVMEVNVLKTGSLYISSNSQNGMSFSGTGVFTTTGIHTITLIGSGIPQLAGTYNFYAIDTLSDTSKFSVVVIPFGGAGGATFTLGGAPGGCSGFLQYGSYTAGVKLNTADSVTTQVIVTKAGAYSIVTAPSNGVVFSTTGNFDSAGVYTVTLKGNGVPPAAGTFNYRRRRFKYLYIFNNVCTGRCCLCIGQFIRRLYRVKLNGTYKNDSALTVNSSVTLDVNVATTGTYSITSNTVNGMTFSGNGSYFGRATIHYTNGNGYTNCSGCL